MLSLLFWNADRPTSLISISLFHLAEPLLPIFRTASIHTANLCKMAILSVLLYSNGTIFYIYSVTLSLCMEASTYGVSSMTELGRKEESISKCHSILHTYLPSLYLFVNISYHLCCT